MLPRYSSLVLGIAGLVWQVMPPLANAQVPNRADVVEKSEQAVVKIMVESKQGKSMGSGFVIDANGTFVTNVHVLRGAQTATATFPNGTTCEIKGTLAFEEAKDICIAVMDGSGFPVLKVTDVLPRKGESVTALGSPRGLSFSATSGVISAIRPSEELGSEIGRPNIKGTWIQVDAAINPGNSGGPLINDQGEVVAMSTLGSQGGAQNLNFGISNIDIGKLIAEGAGKPLVALPEGIGKLEAEDPNEKIASMERPPIPKDKLENYISRSRDEFDDLLVNVRQELSRNKDVLSQMTKGPTYLPPGSPEVEVVRVIDTRTNKSKYFFRSQNIKEREVSKLKTRNKALTGITSSAAKDKKSKEVMYALLSHAGPRLDPQQAESIGFMYEATVRAPLNDHGVIIEYDGAPYLMWVDSAAGLFPGKEMSPVPVFVAGTQTVEVPGQLPLVLTVLYGVTEAELKTAVFGDSSATSSGSGSSGSSNQASEEYRVWKDTSGKFQIEATLVKVEKDEVVLKKKDGKTITVKINKLSPADRQFLKK